MSFPRIKPFSFTIRTTYKVPAYQVGRLDLISVQFYGESKYYKVLAAANNIDLSYGARSGIRPQNKAIYNELVLKGYSGTELTQKYSEMIDESRQNNYDWYSYENQSYGYISDVYEGRLLMIPDNSTSDLYLQQYEYLEDA